MVTPTILLRASRSSQCSIVRLIQQARLSSPAVQETRNALRVAEQPIMWQALETTRITIPFPLEIKRAPLPAGTERNSAISRDGMSNSALFAEIRSGPATGTSPTNSTGSISVSDPNFYATATQLAFATWDSGTPGDTTRWPGTLPGDVERVSACDTPGTNDILYRGKQYYRGIPVPSYYSHTLTPNSRQRDCVRAVGVDRIHAAARSYHAGGAHCVLADGAVRFVSENIDALTWRRVGGIQDGQVVGEF
jgi:hypothetical protein